MSRPRLLTDPAELAASEEFKRCLLASKKTQEQVAAEIGSGVSQGTVWQWANGRLAIPANRAVDAAAAVGADPARISVAWRSLAGSGVAEDRPQYALRSQPVGIPLTTVADAMAVVRAYLEDRGEPFDHLPDPVLIKAALDVVTERAEPLTVANVIAFKRQFATRLRETIDGDEERKAARTG